MLKRSRGRPSTYSKERAAAVLDAMTFDEDIGSVKAACRRAGVPPGSFYSWVAADRDGLADDFVRARLCLWRRLYDDILEIVDDASADYRLTRNGWAFDPEAVQRSRLRAERIMRLASRFLPELQPRDDGGEIVLVLSDAAPLA